LGNHERKEEAVFAEVGSIAWKKYGDHKPTESKFPDELEE
jgi:hypothetical protein